MSPRIGSTDPTARSRKGFDRHQQSLSKRTTRRRAFPDPKTVIASAFLAVKGSTASEYDFPAGSWLAWPAGACRAAGLLSWKLLRRGYGEWGCPRQVVDALLNCFWIGRQSRGQ